MRKHSAARQNVTLSLPVDVVRKVRLAAAREASSSSKVVLRLVDEYLPDEASSQATSRAPTGREVVKGLKPLKLKARLSMDEIVEAVREGRR